MNDRFAIRIGYSQSTQSPEWYRPDQVCAWRNNVHALYFGVDYEQPLRKRLKLSFCPQLVQKGYRMDYSFIDPAISSEDSYLYTLTWIDIPINLSFEKNKWKFRTGIFGSYLLHSDFRFEHKEIFYTNAYIITFKSANPDINSYNRFDYGINLGVSRKLTDYLDLEFNFTRGLSLPDKFPYGEIRYQESFLFGFKYYFLKPVKYPVGRKPALSKG
ncbi:MAG: outer membrane beta-barrel protein [Bacteroidia bacterium]